MTTDTAKLGCEDVEQQMADILAGEADNRLYDHLATCDACRDARHDAERAAALAADAGADYIAPADLEERVLGALNDPGREESASETPDPAHPTLPSEAAPLATEPMPPAGNEETNKTPSDVIEAPAPPAELASPEPAHRDQSAKVTRWSPRLIMAAGAAAVAAAAAVALVVGHHHSSKRAPSDSAWSGRVARVERVPGAGRGLELCNASGKACAPLAQGAAVPAGGFLRTDQRTRAFVALGDGTKLAVDRGSELALIAGSGRHAKLESGSLVADVSHIEGLKARIDVPQGTVEVLGTKFALTATADVTSVDVSRGAVRVTSTAGQKVTVRAGEEGRLFKGMPPTVAAAPALGEALAWSESDDTKQDQAAALRGLGELTATKPGSNKRLDGAVTLTSHSVKVRIAGSMARTEVDETFTNHTKDVLAGTFRFPLPPDAKIERLALEVNGKLEDGAFVDRDRAAAIWHGAMVRAAPKLRRSFGDDIVWVPGPWRDPALLEWQRGGRFELSIYPIPKHGSRRIVLAYTEVLKASGGARHYTYPLAYDPGGSTKVGSFNLDLQLRGNDPTFGVRAEGYRLAKSTTSDGATELEMSAQDFMPSGDLTVEYALPDRDKEMTAWAYQPTAGEIEAAKKATKAAAPAHGKQAASDTPVDASSAYVAIALRPKLPRSTDQQKRVVALVVDSSRSMFGERYHRASELAAHLIDELDPSDRFVLLACDTTCRALPGGVQAPSATAAGAASHFLDGITPDGASDLTAAIDDARAAVGQSDRSLRVVYIGDGTPTVGPIRPAYVTRAVRRAVPAGRGTVTAVAIGTDADSESLQALARGAGGVVVPYAPGESTPRVAFSVLGAVYGNTLSDVSLELPPGLTAVAPARLDNILAGSESFVTARMSGARVDGAVVLHGKVGSRDFEQRYPLHLTASEAKGNAFVPRLYAAERIADLERDSTDSAKQEAIRLSSEFNVASRYTSLLVLESPAMFHAFGLDTTHAGPVWTGEDEAKGSSSSGALATDANDSLDIANPWEKGAAPSSGHAVHRRAYHRAPPLRHVATKPAPAATAAPPWANSSEPPRAEKKRPASSAPPPFGINANGEHAPFADRFERPRRMVPMRRIWKRVGKITTDRLVPKAASTIAIADAEHALDEHPDHREAVRKLYTLYELAGELDKANQIAERWTKKDPLDPEALTARADLAARRGDRDQAIRLLGSVVDVRPSDIQSQERLARLERWSGHADLGCRYSVAVAELHENNAKLLADAVRCGRKSNLGFLVDDMLSSASDTTRKRAEHLLDKSPPPSDVLRGDLKLEATWQGNGNDLDLALLHPDGYRVSWLGAPTHSVITARDVTSTSDEGLALRGAKPGEYVIEITRASGNGPVRGTVKVTAAGTTRSIPFLLEGERQTLGIVKIGVRAELVPLENWRRTLPERR